MVPGAANTEPPITVHYHRNRRETHRSGGILAFAEDFNLNSGNI